MSLDPDIATAWSRYRESVIAVYPRVGERREFVGSEVREEQLEEIAERSSQLTEMLLAQPPENDREANELEAAILAAAALDATVAGYVLSALREEAQAEHPEVELPAAIEEMVGELESIDDLLDLTAQAFPEITGAAADLSPPDERTQRAIVEILDDAMPVAVKFGTGVLTAGAGTLIGMLGPFEPIRDLVDRARDRLLHGSRLIENAVKKLIGLLTMECEVGVDFGLEKVGDALSAGVESFNQEAVGKLVRVGAAERRIEHLLEGKQVDESERQNLDVELNDLCRDFARNMGLTARIEKGIRFSAPALIFIGAGALGNAALSAANGVGLAYCLLALGVRLDTVPGWVPGVPTVLESIVDPPYWKPPRHYEIRD